MFLLKRATTVVLLATLFGILLPDVCIQPAQAEGEVQAGIQTEAKPGAQLANTEGFSGLTCYVCEHCIDDTHLGCTLRCRPGLDYCVFGQVKHRYGWKTARRGCASSEYLEDKFCDEFTSEYDHEGLKHRYCSCKTDLCNNQNATSLTSSSTQLLPFWILVAVSVFGLLMIN